jgi:hypothetical protein
VHRGPRFVTKANPIVPGALDCPPAWHLPNRPGEPHETTDPRARAGLHFECWSRDAEAHTDTKIHPARSSAEHAQQANWTDGKGNHSVGQLTYHLAFWNQRALQNFRGEKPPKFSGNNDETFNNFDTKKWNDTVRQLDQVLTDIEKAVESANDKQLTEWAPTLANISTHNAYHIGEIVMVRKEQGAWDASKGVK